MSVFDEERAHAVVLCHTLLEFVDMLGDVDGKMRWALSQSIEHGWIKGKVEEHLVAAHRRGAASNERPPLVHQPEIPSPPETTESTGTTRPAWRPTIPSKPR
jgi:hypothetical protein